MIIPTVEPIISGTFTGPLLNATVSGGLAYPTILENGTRQDPFITIYGITASNSTFLAQISGMVRTFGGFSFYFFHFPAFHLSSWKQ